MRSSKRVQFALMLLAVIVIPGLADYVLAQNGLETLGMLVWGLGYGGGILGLWYVWLRPLDLTGPEGSDTHESEGRDAESNTDRSQGTGRDATGRDGRHREGDRTSRKTGDREK